MPERRRSPKHADATEPPILGFYIVDSPSGGKAVPSRLRWATEVRRAGGRAKPN